MGFLNFASSFLRIPILCVLLFATAPSQSNAVICNPIEQLRSLFRKDKPFDRDAYQLRVEEFKKTIINNKWEKVEKLSSIDQVALMEALTKSKGRNPLDLADLLQKDPKIRNQVLNIAKKIKSKNGYRLSNLNQSFDQLFEVIHPKIKGLPFFKWKTKKNQVIDQWIGHELGRRDLETAARNLGILKDENAIEKFRLWKKRHSNAINISINASLNTASLRYLGAPGMLPKVKFFRANEDLIRKIEKEGLESIKPSIYAHYQNAATAHLVYETIKKNYIRAFKGIALYYLYHHWRETKGQLNLVYNIGKNSIESLFLSDEKLQKQVDQTFSLDRAQEEEIINTLQTIAEEQNGKLAPNDIWNQVKAHLELTVDDLKPDFTGKNKSIPTNQKKVVTDQQITMTSMKILNELVDEKTVSPSILKKYEEWLKNRKGR